MAEGTCAIDGCVRPVLVVSRGWCKKHYRTWQEYGDPDPVVRRPPYRKQAAPLADYLDARVKVDDQGHWQWTGHVNNNGYGVCNSGGKKKPAHRVVYEHCVGVIPEGMELDHLCFVRSCVNPDHLEPVTTRENLRRVVAAGRRPAVYARKSHCLRGHPLSGPNLRTSTTADGYERRHCRTCDAIHESKRRPRRASSGE